jgi:hypothetical protein
MWSKIKVFVADSRRNNNTGRAFCRSLGNQGKVVKEDRQAISLGYCKLLAVSHIAISAIQRALRAISEFRLIQRATRLDAAAEVLLSIGDRETSSGVA